MRQEFVGQLRYLDSAGKEQRPHLAARDRPYRQWGRLLYAAPTFIRARKEQAVLSADVYFEGGSRPYMTIAVAETAPGKGVVVAEIDLSSVRAGIDRARVGTTGYAYAVNSRGVLVAHQNIDLVARRTSFASLPQVRAALRGPAGSVHRRRDDRT